MTILVKYGEIILKGMNRPIFERKLVDNIRRVVGKGVRITWGQAVIYLEMKERSLREAEEIAAKVSRVFGVVSVSIAHFAEKDLEAIKQKAREVCIDLKGTFKVEAKRSDKRFGFTSPQIQVEVGGYLDDECDGLVVDVRHPDFTVMVEVRENGVYIHTGVIKGIGGLPTGTSGAASLLLSGGIDSPVAGFMIAKRGVKLQAVHFHSYPYTSLQAKEKVLELAKILAGYCGEVQLHIVPFTEIQLEINQRCPLEQSTIIMRRFMMKIADRIALENGADALITGESLAQVASQTIQSLKVTDEVAELPVFRPLIGMDKEEIVRIAREIGSFETSILPYEDCCTVFTPKRPATKPKLERVRQSEEKLDGEALIERAMEGVEVVCISG